MSGMGDPSNTDGTNRTPPIEELRPATSTADEEKNASPDYWAIWPSGVAKRWDGHGWRMQNRIGGIFVPPINKLDELYLNTGVLFFGAMAGFIAGYSTTPGISQALLSVVFTFAGSIITYFSFRSKNIDTKHNTESSTSEAQWRAPEISAGILGRALIFISIGTSIGITTGIHKKESTTINTSKLEAKVDQIINKIEIKEDRIPAKDATESLGVIMGLLKTIDQIKSTKQTAQTDTRTLTCTQQIPHSKKEIEGADDSARKHMLISILEACGPEADKK